MKKTGKKLSLKEGAPFLSCRVSSFGRGIVEKCRGRLSYFASFYSRGGDANVDQRAYDKADEISEQLDEMLSLMKRDLETEALFNEFVRSLADEGPEAKPPSSRQGMGSMHAEGPAGASALHRTCGHSGVKSAPGRPRHGWTPRWHRCPSASTPIFQALQSHPPCQRQRSMRSREAPSAKPGP